MTDEFTSYVELKIPTELLLKCQSATFTFTSIPPDAPKADEGETAVGSANPEEKP